MQVSLELPHLPESRYITFQMPCSPTSSDDAVKWTPLCIVKFDSLDVSYE
ncbi:predicted protein [Plenodomus lingam JN3]|uniref:Predicted protein n=1 Tax=Leptosphaeria maculans (strain JN3 / isolate v23.1.3 / race Av1-4-5-6-7-8) TaxID=985895 RepID=E5AES6_LEPMJ|nr:predicted protein [Plenodomus lingam JN3]CBY01715.1 predicted protein [Plenodomus lingam JN3]